MTASDLDVIDARFSYINENLNNPDILVLDDLNINAEDFLLENSDVFVKIKKLSGIEKRGLDIDFLTTDFAYTTEEMRLKDFEIKTPNSLIKADVAFDISGGFADFVNRVPLVAKFESATVSTTDLQPFYDKFGTGEKIEFSTRMEGTLNDFLLKDFKMEGLDRTRLVGDLSIKNILAREETQIFALEAAVEDLSTNYYDLVHLLPGLLQNKLPKELISLGNVNFKGLIAVSENSLEANTLVFSQLGSADVDLKMKNFGDVGLATYQGRLVAKDFNIGKLLNVKKLGKSSFDVVFDGKGFSAETLNSDIRGSISRLNYNGYVYNNLKLRGTLRAPVFNGNFISLDPNLQMEFNGLVDLSEETSLYDFEASVEYANLNKLNFVSRDSISVFKGDVIMNMQGTNLNNVAGEVLLLNTSYENENDLYAFDDLRIKSSFDGPVRTIEVNSPDVINGTVEGVFDVSQVPALVENAVGSLYTNYRPNKTTTDQYLNFNFDIYNKIVEVFYPEITLAPNTYIRGSVESDESEFRLAFKSPEINAFNNLFEQVNIQVDNSNPLFNTYVEIDSVATGIYSVSDFNLINVTLNDTLFIRSEFRGGPRNDDVYNLNLYHTINENNNSVVGLQKSDIKFKESVWHLNEKNNKSNRLIFSKGFQNLRVDSLVLSHENEEIRLAGQMRDSTYKNFQMEFDNVDLYKITPEIQKLSMGGIVNGSLSLLQENGAYYPNSSLTVKDLVINDEMLG